MAVKIETVARIRVEQSHNCNFSVVTRDEDGITFIYVPADGGIPITEAGRLTK